MQERCKTVQVKVLHRKVLEALHTLLSSLRKSPTQRPCLEELHHSFKFIFLFDHLPSIESKDPAKSVEKVFVRAKM